MKRYLKNIITIAIIVVLLAAMVVTVIVQRNTASAAVVPGQGGAQMGQFDPNQRGQAGSGTVPSMPGNNGQSGSSDSTTPPELPNGTSANDQGSVTPPDLPGGTTPASGDQSSQSSTQPTLNDPTQSNSQSGSQPTLNDPTQSSSQSSSQPTLNDPTQGSTGSNGSTNTPPDLPSGTSGQGGTAPSDIPQNPGTVISKPGVLFYVLIILEGLLLGLTAGYLIVSKANKLGFKETFGTLKRTLFVILICVALCAGTTVGSLAAVSAL